MINIVMPMAGRGSRFQNAGYKDPKPLIPIFNKPMIQVVIENIRPSCDHRFIFICQQEHLENYHLAKILKKSAPNCEIISLNEVTEGAACTVLLAEKYIDKDDSLMIANCDQWVCINIDDYLATMKDPKVNGLIMTMWADDPKWSFVRFDDNNKVTEVVEKKVVSNEATVGIYNFQKGSDFVRGAKKMIDQDRRVKGEFYVAPVYNELLSLDEYHIATYNVGKVLDGMYGLGTPEDLENFLSLNLL